MKHHSVSSAKDQSESELTYEQGLKDGAKWYKNFLMTVSEAHANHDSEGLRKILDDEARRIAKEVLLTLEDTE